MSTIPSLRHYYQRTDIQIYIINTRKTSICYIFLYFLVGEIGLEPIRTMYTSSHSLKNNYIKSTLLYVTFPQVTFFCITGASTISPLPDYCFKELLQSYEKYFISANIFYIKCDLFKRVLNRVPRVPFWNFTATKRRCM